MTQDPRRKHPQYHVPGYRQVDLRAVGAEPPQVSGPADGRVAGLSTQSKPL